MGKKVYAIKEGFDSIKNEKVLDRMVNSWDECLRYVKGVKGAKYKSFESIDEAKSYLNSSSKLLKKGIDLYPMDCIHAYVDGSFNTATEKYSYAYVIVYKDTVIHMGNGCAEDASKKQLRQISGELEGALKALKYALEVNEKKIVLFHDYEGIYHHAVGTWERKESSSKEYFDEVNYLVNMGLEITFVKVDSHTGDIYNEITDNYAKLAAGLSITDAVDKALDNSKIKVKDNIVKEKLYSVISEKNKNKIIVVEDKPALEQEQDIDKIVLNLSNLIKRKDSNIYTYLKSLDNNIKDEIIIKMIRNII